MSNSDQIRSNLQKLGQVLDRYRLTLLRILLISALALALIAQVSSSVSDFLISNRFFSFGLILGLAYAIFEAVIASAKGSTTIDETVVLSHYTNLRPFIEEAFKNGVVELDIASYSGETFYGVLSEFLQAVSEGRLRPRRIVIRLMVPDCSAPMSIPCLTNSLVEDNEYKVAIQRRNKRFASEFRNYFRDINTRFPNLEARFEMKMHKLLPMFKMIIINNNIGFLSFYPIAETAVQLGEETKTFWDFRGERASYVGFAREGVQAEADLHKRLSDWYDVVWNKLSTKEEHIKIKTDA